MMDLHRLPTIARSDPGNWPRLHQALACMTAFGAALLLGWQMYLAPAMSRLDHREQEKRALKNAYQIKIHATADLPAQTEQVRYAAQKLAVLQQHLADSDDRNATLEEIAVIARQHDLTFEFAKPGQTEMTTAYLMHVTRIRLNGRYHDLGRFAADITAMPQIVVLSDVQLSAAENGIVIMDALALTYQRHTEKNNHHAGEDHPAVATP